MATSVSYGFCELGDRQHSLLFHCIWKCVHFEGVLFRVTNLEGVISWLAPSLTEKRFSVISVRSEILLGG